MIKRIILALAVVVAAGSWRAWGQTTAPTRTPQAIVADLQTAQGQLQEAIQGARALQTPESRKAAAPAVTAAIRKILGLIDEMEGAQPAAKAELDGAKMQFYVLGAIMNDPDEVASLTKTAEGTDLNATRAKAELAIAKYINAEDDAARNKALDEYDAALKAAPGDDAIMSLITLSSLAASPSVAVYQHLDTILKQDGQGPAAQQMAQEIESDMKQKQLEGKPLTLSGAKIDGGNLSTDQWKGKVILVDFWATWCGPCVGELPRVKQMYAKYHDLGLEVLGVSSDNAGDDLKKFLAANPDMPWPQLFDEKTPGWHPLATQYGIISIPTMYLIDRKGILRTVNARSEMEDLIPKLLAEKP